MTEQRCSACNLPIVRSGDGKGYVHDDAATTDRFTWDRSVVTAPHACDWPECDAAPEPDFLFCAQHLGAEIARWLDDETES